MLSPKFGLRPVDRIGHFFYANVYIKKFFNFINFSLLSFKACAIIQFINIEPI